MRAVLVFCEGKHDVVFVERSLGACEGCQRLEGPIRELPSPFGPSDKGGPVPSGLIATRLGNLKNIEDISLREDYPPTPRFETIVRNPTMDVVYVLVRAGGKNKSKPVLDLMDHVDSTFRIGGFDVKEHAAAFLFDADDEGLAATVARFQREYGDYFGGLAQATHASWTTASSIPVGVYIFHKGNSKKTGTLDDHIAPMVESAWPRRYGSARRYIDRNRKPEDAVSGNDAKRLKAIITAAAQFDHPGRPSSTVVARNGLPKREFETSPASAALAAFLAATPWSWSDTTDTSALTDDT